MLPSSAIVTVTLVAVDAVNLDIPAGCMVGLIGPDGVGKSSLLALIAGVRKIQQGTVEVLGGDMRNEPSPQRGLPTHRLYASGPGQESLRDPVGIRECRFLRPPVRPGPRRATARIDELLVGTGLAPFRNRPAGKLSGGMKQKLGCAVRLSMTPTC